MAWQFKREEAQFDTLPEGKYRVAIESAEMAVSKSGNDMLVLKLKVSGTNTHLWNYIVFLDDRPEITNRMLTQFFDSFGIEDGDFNLSGYVGRVGACKVKHEDYDGEPRAKIQYFLSKKQQTELPAWQGDLPIPAGFEEAGDDGELPF